MIILSFYFIIFLTVLFLFSHQLPGHKGYASDVGAHIAFVEPFFDGKVYIPHPVWHIAVHYMNYITLDKNFSAVLVNTLFILMWIYIVQAIYIYFIGKEKNNIYVYPPL